MNTRHTTFVRILVLGSALAVPSLVLAQNPPADANANANGQTAPAAAPAVPTVSPAPAMPAAPAASAIPAPAPAAAAATAPAAVTPAPAPAEKPSLMQDIKKDVEHADRDIKNTVDPDRVRHYTGEVKSVDAASHMLILSRPDGKTRSFPLPEGVKVLKGKTAAALSDVAAGAKVRVSYRMEKEKSTVSQIELK